MLILTRHPGQSIRIGDDITVTVLDVTRSGVRIGIDAPREVPVHREEVYLRLQAANAKQTDLTEKETIGGSAGG